MEFTGATSAIRSVPDPDPSSLAGMWRRANSTTSPRSIRSVSQSCKSSLPSWISTMIFRTSLRSFGGLPMPGRVQGLKGPHKIRTQFASGSGRVLERAWERAHFLLLNCGQQCFRPATLSLYSQHCHRHNVVIEKSCSRLNWGGGGQRFMRCVEDVHRCHKIVVFLAPWSFESPDSKPHKAHWVSTQKTTFA